MSDSPNVSLRVRSADDQDALYALASDLDTWEERNPSAPAPLSRELYDARTARLADPDREDDGITFVVVADGAAVGTVSLFDSDALAGHAEVGIALLADARGRGIGTEALRQLVEFAFVRRNLRRLHLEVIASNAAAIRSYEKVGFVVEGRQREHAWVRGAYEDIVRMGILRSDSPAGSIPAATPPSG